MMRTTLQHRILARLVLVLIAVTAVVVQAKTDYNKPHPHGAILSPYKPGPFESMSLNKSDEKKLAEGKSVMKQSMPDADDENPAGGAICVQDIMAPRDAVWSQILDLDNYRKKVSKVLESKNYKVAALKDGSYNIKTKMVMGVMPGYKYTSFYDHTFHPKQGSMVWTLDYDKTSDFDDVSGHWHVCQHPTKPDCTRVFYACDIKMAGSVPKPIINFIGKVALKQATSWVKKESESAPNGALPKSFEAAKSSILAN